MEWLGLAAAVAVIAAIIGYALRNADQSYTMGSGLFKNSENNLTKDEHIDPADYEYFDKKGKLK